MPARYRSKSSCAAKPVVLALALCRQRRHLQPFLPMPLLVQVLTPEEFVAAGDYLVRQELGMPPS